MSNITTIQTLTPYQINQLRELFLNGAQVEKLGICLENKHLVIEYSGGKYNSSGKLQTKIIAPAEQTYKEELKDILNHLGKMVENKENDGAER